MRPILAFAPIVPSALTPAVCLWLHFRYGSTPQGSALCYNLTGLYAVVTVVLAVVGRAWVAPGAEQ
ncbi:hypothetical protein FNV58_01155 (plasmid) [Streptomyces sp. RLB1-9]|uniref:hypothetical protein n=1 Tax=Streptomyces sp. RLB1-9 TaxID=2594454 RepID=UPI00116539E1|nr:hypothetical protein [Streptomyces sp. RLB1-9]QDN94969.1 hypothetical protein FNV58_01155 [Streptomyces sp. RLB1-9]